MITRVLERAGFDAVRCATLEEIHRAVEQCPGAVLIGEEALSQSSVERISEWLRRQPPWSDLPVIVMTSGGEPDDTSVYRLQFMAPLGNVSLIERPFRKVTLLSAVRSALRARERQLQIRDYIEEQRRSEQALRNSEARWRFLANALPQFIWTTRADGTTEFINQYWFDYTGLAAEEQDFGPWFKAVHPEDVSQLEHLWADISASGKETSFEYRVRRASDGQWRWHMGIVKPEDEENDAIRRFVGVGIDIHDRREAEAALRRANAALEQFAYAAAHDLQEPVRNISLYSQLLAKRFTDRMDPQGAEFLRLNIQCANRMQDLIRDLLAYTRAVDDGNAGQDGCDGEQVLRDVLRNLEAAIESSGAEVTHDALPEVAVSGTHLMQLLQNLISNALKYRSTAPPQVHISAQRAGSHWVFSVRDNGQGIPPEYHQRVFQVFKRLHRHEVPGTGIGLAICERVVTHYGGNIWVESEPGHGATFRFTLPAK